MRTSTLTAIRVVSIFKQADAGVPMKDLCRQARISVATYYQWKSKYSIRVASLHPPSPHRRRAQVVALIGPKTVHTITTVLFER
ncbi:transposase [Luteibacter anthropi]|nr:transposase [Luteibacter anthropi]